MEPSRRARRPAPLSTPWVVRLRAPAWERRMGPLSRAGPPRVWDDSHHLGRSSWSAEGTGHAFGGEERDGAALLSDVVPAIRRASLEEVEHLVARHDEHHVV